MNGVHVQNKYRSEGLSGYSNRNIYKVRKIFFFPTMIVAVTCDEVMTLSFVFN